VFVFFVCAVSGIQYCNVSCQFDQTSAWSYVGLDNIPDNLLNQYIYAFDFDGDQTWWDNDCSYFLSETSDGCPSCRPQWTYLYSLQTRIVPSTGKQEYAYFINFAYTPSESAWNSYCALNHLSRSNTVPTFETSDPNTYNLKSSYYYYSANAACYDRALCALVSSYDLEDVESCTPNQYQGYPTDGFCSTNNWNHVTYAFGCNQTNTNSCNSLKFSYSSPYDQKGNRKMKEERKTRSKDIIKKRRQSDTDCLYADTWQFDVSFN